MTKKTRVHTPFHNPDPMLTLDQQHARLRAGLSQSALASVVGKTQGTVSRWEREPTCSPLWLRYFWLGYFLEHVPANPRNGE